MLRGRLPGSMAMVRVLWLMLLFPTVTLARSAGVATTTCNGCHGGSLGGAQATLTAPPQSIALGATVTLTLTLTGSGIANGGFHLTTRGVGTFSAGSGVKLQGDGVSHSTPRAASSGSVSWTVQWTAPSTPGGVEVEVGAVGGNGDGRSSGDKAALTRLSLWWGCAGVTVYSDFDRDGHGNAADGPRKRCVAEPGLSLLDDDCDDNDPRVFPQALEACNGRDDNCNNQSDEGLASVTTWPDLDGDGYGDRRGAPLMGCATSRRAANDTDCNDMNPKMFPGAPEVCNQLDDDCDSQVDEGVRVRCGVGWCARLGPTCDPNLCTVGAPRPEECNAFDDDCDGVVDNGQLCGARGVCFEGYCYDAEAPLPDGGTGAGGGGSGGGGSSTPGGCQSTGWLATLGGLPWIALRRRQRYAFSSLSK